MDDVNRRFETLTGELHRRIDARELQDMEQLNVALSSLELERNTLAKISTWPWQPETIRWLITALVLPLDYRLISPSGRPFTVADKGRPVLELFA